MFAASFRLFNVFGIEIRINPSWGVIAALVAWSLAQGVFPRLYSGLATGTYWVMAVITVTGLTASIILHELAHSIVAARFGTSVSKITLFMFGGAAALDEDPKSAKAEFFIALAGPAMSLAIAGGFYLFALILADAPFLAGTSYYLALINLILAAFNLLPAFPMDGGRVLRAAIWAVTGHKNRATHAASQAGKVFGSIFMGLGLLAVLLGNFVGGLWWVLIGGFIRAAASSEYESLRIKAALAGQTVRDYMTPVIDSVRDDLGVRSFVDGHLYVYGHDIFPVLNDGLLVGTVGLRDLKAVPQSDWDELEVSQIMTAIQPESVVKPDCAAHEALSQMIRSNRTRLLVVEAERLIGILVLKDLLNHLSIRLALDPNAAQKVQTV